MYIAELLLQDETEGRMDRRKKNPRRKSDGVLNVIKEERCQLTFLTLPDRMHRVHTCMRT